MNDKIGYNFSAKIWQYNAPGGWFFVGLPLELSEEIRTNLGWQEEGWGRLKAIAIIGKTEWQTAIWFDKKQRTYLLPLKQDIRTKEQLAANQIVDVMIWL